MLRRAHDFVAGSETPSLAAGGATTVVAVACCTALIYPLKRVAPTVSLGVVYLLAVLIVSSIWGVWMGSLAAALSAAAFNFFHLPPVGRFTIADSRNWVALVAFLVVAVAVGVIAEAARSRAAEADRRRREADLAAELAQLLLGARDLAPVLSVAAQRLALASGLRAAAIALGPAATDEHRMAFPLRDAERQIGTLLVPANTPVGEQQRLAEFVVPALQSVLAAALHRIELESEVVETAALRRSDEMKTALLRSVSHDLRTPLTAVITAAAALDSVRPSGVGEVREVVLEAGGRLRRLIDKLLDLSLLQSGHLEPRREWCALEELVAEAAEASAMPLSALTLAIDPALPLLRTDPVQLERAFANVLENAWRYSGESPVVVRARVVGGRIRVRIIDRGPGVAASDHERVFLPFYRRRGEGDGHPGSGLGLAIARGFVELNGGRIAIESLPGQGTTVVIELPVESPPPTPQLADQPHTATGALTAPTSTA